MTKILLLMLLVILPAAPLRAADFLLFYSNDLHGETEPCGCRSRQLGGLARQALQISTLAEQERLPFLFLNSGGLLFRREAIPAGQEGQEKIRAEGIAEAMRAMGCRASGIGAHDLAGGVELLRRFQAEERLTWLSMNLTDAKSGSLVFAPSLLTEIAGLRTAVLGLTGSIENAPDKEKHVLLPWTETLPKELARLKGKADMIILLSSLPARVNKEIAAAHPEIHLILAAGAGELTDPFVERETLFAQTGSRGKTLGMMRISWTAAGKWAQDGFREIGQSQRQLDYVNLLLERLERQSGKKEEQADEKKRLLAEKQQIEEQIKLLRETRKTVDENSCRFSNQFVALDSSLPEDPKVQKIMLEMTRNINALNQERQDGTGRASSLSTLSGWQSCVKCHPAQAAFWTQTAHARSVQTLKKKEQQFNEDCLVCHVTLPHYDFAKIKAERLPQLPERLRNVGCEVCHGPSAAHAADPAKARTPRPKPDKQVCLGCHTPEHDGNFIFAEKAARVRCPQP